MNHNQLFRVALLLGALSCATSDGYGRAPATLSGTLTAVSDGDSYTVRVCHGDYCTNHKVRLHGADCPEIKHNRNETDQPGGVEARDYVRKNYLGKPVTVTRRGMSFARIVGDVQAGETDLARDLLARGHAMVDPRYSKDKELIAAQEAAKKADVGIWAAEGEPVPAWDWRRDNKAKIIQLRKGN